MLTLLNINGRNIWKYNSKRLKRTSLRPVFLQLWLLGASWLTSGSWMVAAEGPGRKLRKWCPRSQDRVRDASERNFKLNYDLLPNFLTLSLGYNVFWISDVLPASNQLVDGRFRACICSNSRPHFGGS